MFTTSLVILIIVKQNLLPKNKNLKALALAVLQHENGRLTMRPLIKRAVGKAIWVVVFGLAIFLVLNAGISCLSNNKNSGSSAIPAEVLVEQLHALLVEAEHEKGYDRSRFGSLREDDSCGTRYEVLLRDAKNPKSIQQLDNCRLSGGVWLSIYDNQLIEGDGTGLDIDHLVPLSEAWRSGAYKWSEAKRVQFSNDLGYVNSLLAVSSISNQSKRDQGPEKWMPPNKEWHCRYAAYWIDVKTRWMLSVDKNEKRALLKILDGCAHKG